jgi:isoleucyl-tRNA synthetase
VLRLWVAATDFRGEITVSDEILTRIGEAYRRLRNTARFLLANLHDFDPTVHSVAPEKMLLLDQWIVDRAWRLQQEMIEAYDHYLFHLVYQKVHQFCTVDMGSLYLDIIKDRQYTCQANSLARRSTQTALYHIVEALARWLAPILSFTAEEIWQYIPGQRRASIFLETWYSHLFSISDTQVIQWEHVFIVREAVSKELEKLRVAEAIGSSLDAEVAIYCDEPLLSKLNFLQDEWRFVLITSEARLHPANTRPDSAVAYQDFWVVATASSYRKCIRCWHHRVDVGQHADHPDICGRCIENVTGSGEQRRFA